MIKGPSGIDGVIDDRGREAVLSAENVVWSRDARMGDNHDKLMRQLLSEIGIKRTDTPKRRQSWAGKLLVWLT